VLRPLLVFGLPDKRVVGAVQDYDRKLEEAQGPIPELQRQVAEVEEKARQLRNELSALTGKIRVVLPACSIFGAARLGPRTLRSVSGPWGRTKGAARMSAGHEIDATRLLKMPKSILIVGGCVHASTRPTLLPSALVDTCCSRILQIQRGP
jgi:hypothetical protein